MKTLRILTFSLAILLQAFLVMASWHWFFELWSHYLHYVLLFDAMALIILLSGKQWKLAMMVILFIQINLWPLTPYLNHYTPLSETELTLLSSNFFYKNESLSEFLPLLNELNPNILVIHEASDFWSEAIPLADYPTQYLTENTGPGGIFIASKVPGEFTEVALGEEHGLEIKTEWGTILAVHPFPAMTPTMAREANEYFQDLTLYAEAEKDLIIIGDFNATPWSPKMHALLKSADLHDARRGFGFKKTWHSHSPFFHLPIDHALLSNTWACRNFETYFVEGSDHRAIWVELDQKD